MAKRIILLCFLSVFGLWSCDMINDNTEEQKEKGNKDRGASAQLVTNAAQIKDLVSTLDGVTMGERDSAAIAEYMDWATTPFEMESEDSRPAVIEDCFDEFYQNALVLTKSANGLTIAIKGTVNCKYRASGSSSPIYEKITDLASCVVESSAEGCVDMKIAMEAVAKVECVGGQLAELGHNEILYIGYLIDYCVGSTAVRYVASSKSSQSTFIKRLGYNKELEICASNTTDPRCFTEKLQELKSNSWYFNGTTDGGPCNRRINGETHEMDAGCLYVSLDVQVENKINGALEGVQNELEFVEYRFPAVKGEKGERWFFSGVVEEVFNDWKGTVKLDPSDGTKAPVYNLSKGLETATGVVGEEKEGQSMLLLGQSPVPIHRQFVGDFLPRARFSFLP